MPPNTPTIDDLRDALTVAEVSERTLRSQHLIRDDIYTGKLQAYRLGGRWRILPEDLERFLATLVTPSRGTR
ncbi:helix-turn-helix domain-containing protein [Actinomycetota bacterium]